MTKEDKDYRVIALPSNVSGSKLTNFTVGDGSSVISGDYLVDVDGYVYEVVKFLEDKRSWFAGDLVIQNGALLMITKVDPLFIVLPHLYKDKGLFKSLEDLLTNEKDIETIIKIFENDRREMLSFVADVKELDDELYYRFNEDKLVKWLKVKVNRTVKCLKDLSVDVSPRSTKVSGFTSGRKIDAEEKDYIVYACGLMEKYLDKSLLSILHKTYDVKIEDTNQATPKSTSKGQKRTSTDMKQSGPIENYYQEGPEKEDPKKKQKVTRSQKQLEQAAKGQRKIAGFFLKEPK